MNRPRIPLVLIGTTLLSASLCVSARSQSAGKFDELLKRIPRRANVILFADVDALANSPLGKQQGWDKKSADGGGTLLGLPASASRVVAASEYRFNDSLFEWRVGMAEFRGALPSLEMLARREGGFVEPINLTKVVWTPRDFYYLTFEPNILGFATPAERQPLSGWITSTFVKPRTFPPGFADTALNRAEKGSTIVLAINLQDTVSAPLVKPWLTPLESVKRYRIDPGTLSEKLAKPRWAYLEVNVKNTIQGAIRVDCEYDVEYAKPVAKEVVLATLDHFGADLPDLQKWSGGAKARSITLEGQLSEESLRHILSFVHVPSPTPDRSSADQVQPANPAPAENKPATAPAPTRPDVVKTSQAYFRSVADALDGLQSQKATSAHGARLWYERYSKQIDELPIVGVDSDLLDWGSSVSRTLREMAYGINYNMQDRRYSLSTQSGAYGGYGVYAGNQPQEAVRQQGEAMLSVGLDGKWQLLRNSVADMRRKMVEKYMVDF